MTKQKILNSLIKNVVDYANNNADHVNLLMFVSTPEIDQSGYVDINSTDDMLHTMGHVIHDTAGIVCSMVEQVTPDDEIIH